MFWYVYLFSAFMTIGFAGWVVNKNLWQWQGVYLSCILVQRTCQGMLLTGQWYFAFHCLVGSIFDLSSRKTCVCRLTGLRRPYPTCFCEAFYIYCVVGLIFACQFLLTVRECLTIQVEGIFMQVDWFALNLPYMLWLSVLHLLFSRFTFLHVLSRKMLCKSADLR